MTRSIDLEQVSSFLPRGARVLVQGGAGESCRLAEVLERAGRDDVTCVGVFLPGVNEHAYGASQVTTFFLTRALRGAGARVTFLPLSYTEIVAYLRATAFDAAFATTAPPDAYGNCSFGVAVDFLAELWPWIPVRIAEINQRMPRTFDHPGIPFTELTATIECDAPLLELSEDRDDETAIAIGERVGALIPDGATVQAGIGKLPGAAMRALTVKRGLRIHSGFISDWALELLAAGALVRDKPIVTGLAIGSAPFYAELSSAAFAFRPVSHTHNANVMRTLRNFVTINAALAVDLFGQVYAERAPDGFASGPGGAADFARGAKLTGGLRIIVLPADAKGGAVSRIVASGAGLGPVSLSRFDVDVVVTQYGAADLRGVTHDERAHRLCAIAAPDHRDALARAWSELGQANSGQQRLERV